MRILFVTQIVPYPPHGGVLQRGYNLLRELGKQHSVHLLAFHHPDELPHGEPLERSKAALREFCDEVEYFSLWPKQSRMLRYAALAAGAVYPRPFSVLAHHSRPLANRISSIFASAPPDVVHLDTIALAPFRRACGRAPVLLTHHNIESQLMRRRAEREQNPAARVYVRVQARRLRLYERRSAEFDLNITVSDADAATLEAIAPGVKTAVVPNGVDTEYYTPRLGEETPALVYTGGMNMFANRDAVEWFIDRVWPFVRERVPQAKFFAIGQRPSEKLLAAAARDPAIEAPGFVDDIRPWVARSAVYVVPLRVGGGTRLKVLDAMAQGKAIVSTSVGAEGIAGKPGRDFILADDPAAFAREVVELLGNAERRRQLGAAARALAEGRYSWPLLGQKLADTYMRAVESR